MKAFVISAVLLVAILCAVAINSAFVTDTALLIRSSASIIAADGTAESAISELERAWSTRRLPLSLSVDLDTIERIDELVISLRPAYAAGAHHELTRLCLIITDLCDELMQYERLSFYAIF